MKIPPARKIVRKVIPYAVIIAVVLFFASGGSILGWLQSHYDYLESCIGARLARQHGLVFLADFDAPVLRDAVSKAVLPYWGVPRVDGKFGSARTIDLNKRPLIQIPATRFLVNSGQAVDHDQNIQGYTGQATFAAWFRPVNLDRRQILFSQRNKNSEFQLFVFQEKLHLSVRSDETNCYASCQFAGKPGKFHHIAFVQDKNKISVSQNGKESLRFSLDKPIDFSLRINYFGADVHSPFEGDIDDLAIWNRALSQEELLSIAKSSCGLKRKYEPIYTFLANTLEAVRSFTAGFYRSVGRLAPPLLNPAPIAKNIPKITIWPSDKESRHFLTSHEKSLASGYRTEKAAEFRRMNVTLAGRTIKAEVALDDVYGRSDAKRMSFIVKDPSRTVIDGCGMIRLYPPELHVALHPDAPYPLPLSGRFVRFFHNDSFKGLYVLEPFSRTGGAWMARGERELTNHKAIYYHTLPASCDLPPEGVAPNKAFNATASFVLSDTFFPWARQEIRARRRAHSRRHDAGHFEYVTKFDKLRHQIAADNPSPMYVTNNLVLNLPGVTWESSDPELVSSDGHVTRPTRGAPRPVMLTPVGSDGKRGKPIRIRVAPVAPDLQTLFIHIGFPVEKHRRTDFVCFRIPEGGGESEWISGIGGSNGGIKHRGNTSYVKGAKRSFSLEFDNKVSWPGSSRDAQHVLLFSGYADPTRLRNKISFDSYRLASTVEVPCGAIHVTWSEVFINGEYFGIWETCRRVKDICDPKTYLYKIRAFNHNLWKTTSTHMAECVSAHDPRTNAYRPLESLFEFTSGATREDFSERIEDTFYVDSLIDYILMLNFTENFDGQVTNQYIARRKGEDKWFIVPWDYDKTFFDGSRAGLSNRLVDRMIADIPGFEERIAQKWKYLRAGPMTDEAVIGRIDADAEFLSPYMVEEYMLLQPLGWDGDFASAVDHLKEVVVARLRLLDKQYGVVSPYD